MPAAHAEDVVPQILMQASKTDVPGRAIDMRGLVPGMSLDEARSVLAGLINAKPEENLEKTILHEAGVTITGTPFVKYLSGNIGPERVSATFSGVSSGNQVVLASRRAEYRETSEAPLFADFLAALTEKYGEPSFRNDAFEASVMVWTYKDGRSVACQPKGTPQCLEPESAFQILEQASEDFDVIVYAAAAPALMDPNRVGQFIMSATDLRIKVAAEEADEAGLRPALDAAISQSMEAAPKPVM